MNGVINDEILKNEVLQGLQQVDETFAITEFSYTFDKKERRLYVSFKAQTQNGETIDINNAWG